MDWKCLLRILQVLLKKEVYAVVAKTVGKAGMWMGKLLIICEYYKKTHY